MKNWNQTQRLTAAVIFVLFCWATAFSAIKMGLESLAPMPLAFARFFVSSVVLAIIAYLRGIRRPEIVEIPWLLICGLVGVALYHTALNFGQQTVPPGTASLIINCSPIFTALLATIFLREDLNSQAWSGILISFIGVTIISVGKQGGISFEPGVVLILMSALSISVYAIVQKSQLHKFQGFEFAAYSVWIGTFGLSFSSGLFSGELFSEISHASMRSLLSILYLGVFPGALSYIAWAFAITKMPASRVVSFMYFIPVLAIITAFILFRELPSGYAILGGIIALGGVYILHSSKRKVIL
jgi:drug/metabolite transporter (DMT)-like permease